VGGNGDAERELEIGGEKRQGLRRFGRGKDGLRFRMAEVTSVGRAQDVTDGGAEVHHTEMRMQT
jgi:hypothetical protein